MVSLFLSNPTVLLLANLAILEVKGCFRSCSWLLIVFVGWFAGRSTVCFGQNGTNPPVSLVSSSEFEARLPSDQGTEKTATVDRKKSSEEPVLGTAESEIEALKKRLEALEKKNKGSEEKTKQDSNAKADKKWNVKLGGHIQMDYVTWANADDAIPETQNYFNFRRLRLVADGTGYDQFDFRLQMTLEPGQALSGALFTSPDVKDAYVSMNDIPGIGRFRIGNFFVPFSLEQVTNDTNNIFVERSIPSQGIFAADREVGMATYNSAFDDRVTWTTGIFFDEISDTVKTRFDDNQGYRLSGRLTWLPVFGEVFGRDALFHTGVGILHTGDFDEQVRFRARPQVQRGPFLLDTGVLNSDTFTTGNFELASGWGAVTSQTELFVSQVNLNSGRTIHVGGAYTHLSYFLTGEHRIFEPFGQHGPQFSRNVPARNFSTKKGSEGWGALELKARWSLLDLTEASAGQYNDFTAGFNWYWSDRTRIMFDWIHPFTSSQTSFGETEADLLAMRFDVNW